MLDLIKVLLTIVSVVLLLLALGLGILIPFERVDPNLHGMLALLAVVLAVAIHIRIGGGLDFLALVLLIAAVGIGMILSGRDVTSPLHSWVGVAAVVISIFAQTQNLFRAAK